MWAICVSLQPFSLEVRLLKLCFGLQVVRSSLLPGMLKTMGSNKDAPRPIKVLNFLHSTIFTLFCLLYAIWFVADTQTLEPVLAAV